MFISNLKVGWKTLLNAGPKAIHAFLLLVILLTNNTGIARADSGQVQSSEPGQSDVLSSVGNDLQHPEPGIGERLTGKEPTPVNLQISKSINTLANSFNLQSSSQCVQPPAGLIDWWTAD